MEGRREEGGREGRREAGLTNAESAGYPPSELNR